MNRTVYDIFGIIFSIKNVYSVTVSTEEEVCLFWDCCTYKETNMIAFLNNKINPEVYRDIFCDNLSAEDKV